MKSIDSKEFNEALETKVDDATKANRVDLHMRKSYKQIFQMQKRHLKRQQQGDMKLDLRQGDREGHRPPSRSRYASSNGQDHHPKAS